MVPARNRSRACRTGCVGSSPEAGIKKARLGTAFSEQDQEDLYHQTADAQRQGRGGIGQRSLPKKVAGARWQGTKVKLDDSSDEGEPGSSGSEQPPTGDVDEQVRQAGRAVARSNNAGRD